VEIMKNAFGLLLSVLLLSGCPDQEATLRDHVRDYATAVEARAESCGSSTPDVAYQVETWLCAGWEAAGVDCDSAVAMDLDECLAAIADLPCSSRSFPTECDVVQPPG
jgi:hypothetical protein